ncbi:MAG: family phosphohydrolase [Clostridiaceae bacterium]|jgi:HD-GYP domain-containing protein (c-di-GMP phosphodiesterase class II)|nr:family phosphohydrolase [Clostridiaceae bacterium]
MRFELVRNLNGKEILGKTLYDSFGRVLLTKGSKLSIPCINKIKQNGFYYIYVEDNRFNDIKQDEKIQNLKETALTRIPNIFNDIIDGNNILFYELCQIVDNIVEYIVDKGDINTNLYEINKYDNYTYIHSVDTSIMAVFLGKALRLKEHDLKQLALAAILHDIGKIGIPEIILNKKGPLADDELNMMRKHPLFGYNTLKKTGINDIDILNVVLEHHERVDGKGYPFGTKGDKLSNYSKIVSVCDVFTAISANRSYRPRFNPNEAYEYILSGINTMFEERIVSEFKKAFSIYPLGCRVKLSNGVIGYVVKQNKNFPDRPIIRITDDAYTNERISPYEINLVSNTNIIIDSVSN